ncbi:MAG TPA: Ger(x)C family spore germination C-terminal domain-containing protein [Bacillota bacterium]|nr:Ger(x)C family spore germination C-terminal domain-containing protein [Bacillota bacterium]
MITSSGEEISRLVDMGEITGAAYPVSLQDFNASLSIAGLEATAPRVITVAPKKQIEVKGGSEQDLRYDEEREGDVRIEGIAAFRGTRLVGWLEDREALGFGWITGKHLKAYKVSEPAETSFSPNLTFYRIRHSKGGIKVNIHQGKPAFAVDVHVEADLRKYYSDTSSKFLGPEVISRLERKLVDSIRVDIQQALRKGQKELKTDIFGFGFALFRKNPDLWQDKYAKNWQQTFPNIPITLKVSARVTNTGTITNKLEVK